MKRYLLSFIVLLFLLNLGVAIANEKTCTACVGGTPTGQVDQDNCTIYNCPSVTCSACVGGTDTGQKDSNGCPIYSCPSVACSKPICEGVYDTGKIDSNGCIIYACPSVACTKCKDGIDTGKIDDKSCPIYTCPSTACSKPICDGIYDTGAKDSNGCIIYRCPSTACTACVDGKPTGKFDANSCEIFDCPATKTCTACVGGIPTGTKDKNGCQIYTCPTVTCPVGCNCDEKGNVLDCSTSKPCPVNCNCDNQGNIISCTTSPQCPANCNCDDKGNIIECSTKISCPSKCKCDNSGNILDCEKSECIDSDGGKNYYEKGKVFVPHSDSTYVDECAYEKKGYEANDHNLLFEAYCFVDKYGYGYDYYSCPNGCKDGACIPFYEKIEEVQTKTEKGDSSSECSNEICKEISKKCLGSNMIIIEQCTFYVKSNNKCEEIINTNSKILKGECDNKEVNQIVTFCQGCQLDESTCIPFGTRLEKKDSVYYCDITKKMADQKQNKVSCQNSYECLSNNCKSSSCTPICEGCLNDNKACVPVGTRTNTQFCDSDYSFKNQNSEDNTCNNNYECSSNVCVNNNCISPSLMQRIIEWFKKLFS